MNTTTNFELQTYEANDIVNVMTVDKSNMEKIDEVMKANQLSGIGKATENKSGSVHAITRANSDVDVFRFTATSNFTAGDTFVVDTVQVTALLPSGESLGTGAYVIGSEVLCSLRDTLLTVYVTSGVVAVAEDSEKLGGNLPEYYGTASDVAQAQATASAAGVLAQSNTQLISGLDTRVETLERGGSYAEGSDFPVYTYNGEQVYRHIMSASDVSITSGALIDSSLKSSDIKKCLKFDFVCFVEWQSEKGYRIPYTARDHSQEVAPAIREPGIYLHNHGVKITEWSVCVDYIRADT